MDNENFKPDNSEEEYNFSDTESVPAFAEAQTKKNIFETIKRKNFLIALVAIIGLLAVYKLADVLFFSVPTAARVARPMATIKNPPMVQQPGTTVASSTPSPIPASVMPMEQAVGKKLDAIEQQNQSNTDRMSSQISELQNTIVNLEARLNNLNNTTQDLIAQQEKAAAKKAVKSKARVKQTAAAPRTVYFVRALVPGRAWLATAKGGPLTVSLGDNLPGYGIVTMIDVNQGTLTTSSGAIIGYSPEDS